MGAFQKRVVSAQEALQDPMNRVLVITGAGISAESGVPTFRGEGELWRDRHFAELATPQSFEEDPKLIWDWYLYRRSVVAGCRPNDAHRALAERARRSHGLLTLVTQNVDDLHEASGYPELVIHYHGSLWHNRCTKCGEEREDRSLAYDALPFSPCCGALERPAIVWFGEGVSKEAFCRAQIGLLSADVLLVVGSSGVVNTAADYAELAMSKGILTIAVNLEPCAIPAHYFIQGKAGEVLPDLLLS